MLKKIIILFITLFFICGCAKKEPSTVLTETTSKEISQLQKDIEKSTCENKESFIARLNSINTEVKSINEMCTLRYDTLKQENSKLKIIIGSLILILLASGYIIIKKRV